MSKHHGRLVYVGWFRWPGRLRGWGAGVADHRAEGIPRSRSTREDHLGVGLRVHRGGREACRPLGEGDRQAGRASEERRRGRRAGVVPGPCWGHARFCRAEGREPRADVRVHRPVRLLGRANEPVGPLLAVRAMRGADLRPAAAREPLRRSGGPRQRDEHDRTGLHLPYGAQCEQADSAPPTVSRAQACSAVTSLAQTFE